MTASTPGRPSAGGGIDGVDLAGGDGGDHGRGVGDALDRLLEGVAGLAGDLDAAVDPGERGADALRRDAHAVSSESVRTITLCANCTLKALSRRGCAASSSASAASANASAVGSRPRRTLLRPLRPPRHVGDAAERDPDVLHRAVLQLHRGGDGEHREREARPVADLPIRRARGGRAELDGGDQVAGVEDGVVLRLVAGQPVQAGDRDRALAVGAEHVDVRADGGQRDRHVRGVGGDAVLGVAEDREVAVLALERRAAGAGAALVARLRDVLEVAAARALEEVAADGREVAQLAGGAGEDGVTENGVALADQRVRGEVGVADGGADPHAVGGLLDRVVGEAGDVDEARRLGHAQLHQVDEVGAAAEEGGAVRGGLDRGGRVAGPLVRERLHATVSAIAATMFGYAPQRQRLPLMRSRISGASSVAPSRSASAIIPTAEHSWPGVQ